MDKKYLRLVKPRGIKFGVNDTPQNFEVQPPVSQKQIERPPNFFQLLHTASKYLAGRKDIARSYGKARPEGPSRRGTVFLLRPAGPKVEARRAEAKFWVWLICGATVASHIVDRPKLSCQRAFRRAPARHDAVH